MTRILLVLVSAVVLYVLFQIDITVPALSLLGVIAWAVFSTLLAIGYRRSALDTRKDRQ